MAAASTVKDLEEVRVRYLGRKSELTRHSASIGDLPPEERGKVGEAANAARQALEALIGGRDEGARGRRARRPSGRGPDRRDAAR